MNLKNIYERKDFVKINEFLGGNEGGTGSGNGFANNAALQETLLGQILNGMFKSISWLWRKSKENFTINRLTARVSNELLRGVILYCFANNINIGTGQAQTEENIKEETGGDQNSGDINQNSGDKNQSAEDTNTDQSTEDTSKEEVEEVEAEEIQPEDIGYKETEWKLTPWKSPEEFKNHVLSLPESERNKILNKLEQNNKKDAFITMLTPKEKQDLGLPAGSEPKGLSEHVDKFEVIKNDIDAKLLNDPKPDDIKKIFGVKFDINKVVNIKNTEGYEDKISQMQEFLNANVSNYNKMKGNQKENIRKIYMNYIISKNMLNKIKQKNTQKSVAESYKLNEDFEAAPMSDPRAGSDPKSKKLSTSVTVGGILTKRDKEKYKEHEEEIKLNIADINLAEIEKEIGKREHQGEVSKYVNQESLKTIQMTAENLFLPSRTSLYKKPEVGDKTVEKEKLRLRWQKELSKIYTSFFDLMDISKVDIRGQFRPDLENKLEGKVDDYTKDNDSEINANKIEDSLKDFLNESTSFGRADGKFSFFSFIYDHEGFNCGAIDIPQIAKLSDMYVLKITNSFGSTGDGKTLSSLSSNYENFRRKFTKDNNSYDVYFLFKTTSKINRNNKNPMFILNVDKRDNSVYLFKKDKTKSIKLNDLDPAKVSDYKMSIDIKIYKLFNMPMGDKLREIFKFPKDGQPGDYRNGKVPKFYTLIEIPEKIKILSTK